MATLNIDGVGKVDIDDAFLSLPPDKQAQEVDFIASQLKGGAAPAATNVPQADIPTARTDPNGGITDEQVAMAQFEQNNPKPDELASRGSILPIGRDKEGGLTLALPSFLEGPRKTVMDLIEGRRTADQISGKEMFELGSLFGGAPAGGPAGTGAGIARAAAQREAVAATPEIAPPAAVPAVASEAAPAAVEKAVVAAVPETPPATAAAPAIPKAATTEELKASAKSFYKQAEDAGVVVKPESIRPVANEIFDTISKEGLDPTLHPRSTAAMKRIDDLADQPLSLQTLEVLRRVANAAGKGMDKDEGRIAGIIKDKLDDFMSGLSEKDLVTGDAKAASELLPKARDLWSKVAKLEHVDDLVERAKIGAPNFSGSGLENALRTEFRALAKNQRAMRTFTPQEQKAIKKIAMGTPASNAARAAGKFAPTGVVSTVLSGGGGAAIGGPVGAVALPAAGFLARRLATAMAERYIKQLETTIRNGGDSAIAMDALKRSRASLEFLKSAPQVTSAATSGDKRAR